MKICGKCYIYRKLFSYCGFVPRLRGDKSAIWPPHTKFPILWSKVKQALFGALVCLWKLQVRYPEGMQQARRFHAPAGGTQVGTVHRGIRAPLQYPLNITCRHRPRASFCIEGGLHNQHPSLQRRRATVFLSGHQQGPWLSLVRPARRSSYRRSS